jgi:hypothetical protein
VRVDSFDNTQPHGASGNEIRLPLFRARNKSDKPMVATITDCTTDEKHGQGPRRAAGGRRESAEVSPLESQGGPPPPAVRVFPHVGGSGFPRARRRGFSLARCARFSPRSPARVCPSLAALGLPLSRGRGRPSLAHSRLPSALLAAAARGPPWPFLAPPTAARGFAPPAPLDTIRNNSSRYNAPGRRHPHPP